MSAVRDNPVNGTFSFLTHTQYDDEQKCKQWYTVRLRFPHYGLQKAQIN